MSEPLTMDRVLIRLQMVLHDLAELAGQAGVPFQGLTINGLNFTYRDQGTTFWKIKITPEGMPDDDDLVEEIPMDEYLNPDEDEADPIEEAFIQGVDEARQ
jgi:hypothetical protein